MLAEAIIIIPKSANKGTEIQMDVLPLVLCKDCKWYDEQISMCDNCGLPREQTFFCADGKRK